MGPLPSNMAIGANSDGKADAFASDPTQLILSISGYFAPRTAARGEKCHFASDVSRDHDLSLSKGRPFVEARIDECDCAPFCSAGIN